MFYTGAPRVDLKIFQHMEQNATAISWSKFVKICQNLSSFVKLSECSKIWDLIMTIFLEICQKLCEILSNCVKFYDEYDEFS